MHSPTLRQPRDDRRTRVLSNRRFGIVSSAHAPFCFADVQAARVRVAPYLDQSPVRHYPQLDALVGHGVRVLLKHDNHLPVNTFKVRNAVSALTALPGALAARGVAAASTGNHGQGLAWAGERLGIPITICVPEGNNPEKNAAIRSYGARLVEVGSSYDDAARYCGELADAEQLTVIHSTNHRDVLAGAATLTDEFLDQAPELDAIVLSLGGGSQAVGAIVTRDTRKPSLEVYAAQSHGAPAQHNAWRDGNTRSGEPADTFAEGIATGSTYALTFETLRDGLHDFVLVSDAQIAQAVRDLLRITHNLAEGAGATGLAGLDVLAPRLAGKTVGLVLCGGNMDTARLAAILAARV
jgi:threonine dehydratase